MPNFDPNSMLNNMKNNIPKIAELKLKNEPLIFEFGNNYMATIQRDFSSEKGFRPLIYK